MNKKKSKIKKKGAYHISTMITWLLALDLILLTLMSLQENPNPEIIKIFAEATKLFAGALAGAIAGERYEK